MKRPITWRVGNVTDIAAVVAIGEAMHGLSRVAGLPFDADRMRSTLEGVSKSLDGLFLVAVENGGVVGGLAAISAPHWYSRALVATALGIFVPPDRRGGIIEARLLRGYIAWAREMDVPDEMIVCSPEAGERPAVYTAAGFRSVAALMALPGAAQPISKT